MEKKSANPLLQITAPMANQESNALKTHVPIDYLQTHAQIPSAFQTTVVDVSITLLMLKDKFAQTPLLLHFATMASQELNVLPTHAKAKWPHQIALELSALLIIVEDASSTGTMQMERNVSLLPMTPILKSALMESP